MAQTIRVALSTYNALTDSDINHYALYADSDNILIKEKARGSGNVAGASSVAHNLGYIPFFIVMGKTDTGEYKVANAYQLLHGDWRNYVDDTNLNFDEFTSSEDDYQYYIFYDNFT